MEDHQITKTNQKLVDIHLEALRRFDRIQTAQRDERLQCLQDRRFYSVAGAQWEGPLAIQFENKPRFEVNKIHLSVIRIINQYRNNRIDAYFKTKDGSNSAFTEQASDMYRSFQHESIAQEAADNAFEEGVGGGFGAWRLRNVYEDDEDENNELQKIIREPIVDADSSVFFDLNAKLQSKMDATHAFILSYVTRECYKDTYNREPTSIPKQIYQVMFDWLTPDVVYVAEYYVVEFVKENIYYYQGLDGIEKKFKDHDFEENETLKEELEATGFKEVRRRKIKRRRIHKYIMDGAQILEDCGYIAGKWIPIIPYYGKRWVVDNVERCMGHVRLAKDPQRLKNMQLSKLGEYAAISPLEKPILTPEQIAGHAIMWTDDNIKNHPYLLINPLKDQNGQIVAIGPQAYRKPPDIPPAMAALLQITEQDMQDLLGNQQATEQIRSNVSGEALSIVQNNLDMQSYIYISNMGKCHEWEAAIWLDMAKEIYLEEGRLIKALDTQAQVSQIEIRRPIINDKGDLEYENDFNKANFEVSIEIGPSTNNKRQAIVKSLLEMMSIAKDPETLQVLSSMTMMNMEGDGINDIREYFRKKLVKLGVSKATEEDIKEMQQAAQNAQPDPQVQFLQASTQTAEKQGQKYEADTMLAMAKSQETEARVKEIEAKTLETLSRI